MKTFARIVFFSLLGWLVLAACSPNTGNLNAGSVQKDASETGGGLYPPQDLSLVANTGRPQFLDSYADW